MNVSGNPIILENASNNNIITTNTFTLSGHFAYVLENYKTNICQNNNVTNNTFTSSHSGYEIIKIGVLENSTLYYNEELKNKTIYDNLNLTLVKKDISNRIK